MVSPKLVSALKKAKALGRGGDTMLAHINPKEADILKRLGGSGTINPHTKLPEFDNPSMGDYGGSWSGSSSSSSNYSNYTGGSDLGGFSGSGNTTYTGGDGGSKTATTSYKSAAAVDAATNNYGGGGYGVGGSSGPTPNSSSGASTGGSWNSPSTYSGGTSVSNNSSPQQSAASTFGSALSAGAGMAKSALSSIGSGLTNFSDSMNGILSDAQPTINSYGNQVANTLGEASDALNAGIASGYNYAKNFISEALDTRNQPSYVQYASGGVGAPGSEMSFQAPSGPPGLRSEAANGGYEPPSSFPSMVPDINPGPGQDPNSYIGGSRLIGWSGTGGTIYSGFGTTKGEADRPAEDASPAYSATANPDVSYALRFNPGTMQNAEYIKGAQIKDQFPNVDFGGLSNTEVGRIVTRSIAGEAANQGELGQQLVGSNMMNRLALANMGLNSEGRRQNLSFKDVMGGYDANGFDARRVGPANSVYNNPGDKTEWNAFNAMSAVLSPNAVINQARTNPVAAMELGAQYNVDPAAVANAIQSTHYYDPRAANPSWGPKMTNTDQIGNHLFGSLNTSPNAFGAVNSTMTGFAIPNPGEQYASAAPMPRAVATTPSPSADPNAQVQGGSGNYLGQVGTDTPHTYEVDAGKLVADIRANNFGTGLFSDQSLIDKVVASNPEAVRYNPETGKITVAIGDVNGDGTINKADRDAVLQSFKKEANVDPSGYAVAVAPPAPVMDGNIGTQFAQPNRPITPTPQYAYTSPADVPAPNATTVVEAKPQYLPDHPITPTPEWAYNQANPNVYAAPLTLPAQPEKGLGMAMDLGFGLTPLGIPNAIAGLFGYSVGDMAANRANIPMTPEEALAAENRMIASGEGKGNKTGPQVVASYKSKDVVQEAKVKAKAATKWKQDAIAWGFSEEQLADPEVADLIKQVYDMGFIPQSA